MTAKERIDYVVNAGKNADFNFLVTMCHQAFAPQFKREAVVETKFEYNYEVGKYCWYLKEKYTGYQINCETLPECYECFLRFIFENVNGIA